ncbi:MAG: ABC transporter substrate-binding protein [Chloroflexi bacterium]|nr:ABC transporter substrate-binding protein [Chloroflexota bacterium]
MRSNDSSDSKEIRQTRRAFLGQAGRLALGIGLAAAAAPLLAGCKQSIRLGIVAGTQTLWRYVAYRKDELLGRLGYDPIFEVYETEAALRDAFLARRVDVIATLPPLTPALAESGADVQFFLPIAWIREGYPLVVPAESPARKLTDLVGKKVGVFPLNHPGFAYWRAFIFKNYGFRVEERLTVREDNDPASLLLNGEVDAGVVDSMVWAAIKDLGQFRVVSDLATEWKAISGSPRLLMYGGYLARRDWIQGQKKFVDDFIRVNFEAYQRYKSEPVQVIAGATSYSGDHVAPLSDEANRAIARYLGYDDAPAERMHISPEDAADYETVFRLLAECGYLAAVPRNVAGLFYIA